MSNTPEAVGEIIELNLDNTHVPLRRVSITQEEKDRENLYFSLLILQAGLFATFQFRLIMETVFSSATSPTLHTIAKQSQPVLLAAATGTVAYEIWDGIRKLANASTEEERQSAIESLAISVPKGITISAFWVNAIYELIGAADPTIAKAAVLLFVGLIALEIIVHGHGTASLPPTSYMCIALFVDCFIKAFILPGATMQLFEETAFYGFCIAMVGFAGVMLNVYTAKQHLNKEKVTEHSETTPLHLQHAADLLPSDGESFGLNTSSDPHSLPVNINDSDSVGNDMTTVSDSSCCTPFWERAKRIRPYFEVKDLSASIRPGNA